MNDNIEMGDSLRLSDHATFAQRAWLSIQHIQLAALFARLSADAEGRYDGTFFTDLITDYQAYVTGAIFTAIAFLEATVNEVYADAADNVSHGAVKDLSPEIGWLIAARPRTIPAHNALAPPELMG